MQDLDRLYGAAPIGELVTLLDSIEQHISSHLKDSVMHLVAELEPHSARLGGWGFKVDDRVFELLVDYRDITKQRTIAVLVTDFFAGSTRVAARVPIDGVGKFSQIEVLLPDSLSRHLEPVLRVTKDVVEAGYTWLYEYIRSKAGELESSLVTESYRAVRVALSGRPDLVESVWLAVIAQDKSTYLFDLDAFKRTMKKISVQLGRVRQSPAALFLGLLTSDVPFKLTFTRHSIPTGECLQCDLSKAEYAQDETLYAMAERVLYRSLSTAPKAVSVYPIVRDEQPFLIAVFPTVVEPDVLPLLVSNQTEIARAFAAQKTRARAFFNKLHNAWSWTVSPRALGEFVGSVIKGMN